MPDAWGRRLWSRRLRMMAATGTGDGVHRSAGIGSGVDLAGIRPFEPGDDPRKLDARASARRGFPHVRDDFFSPSQTLHFVIEGRARLAGAPTLLAGIKGVVATLAPVALACGDPVALTLVEKRGIRHWPATRHPSTAPACLANMDSFLDPNDGPGMEWPGLVTRGALALVITDGLSRTLPGQLGILSRRSEIRLILVRNPWLESGQPENPLLDPETNEIMPAPSASGWKSWLEGAFARIELHRVACPRHANLPDTLGVELGLWLGSLLADSP